MSTLKHTPGPWCPHIASEYYPGIDAQNNGISIVIVGDIHDQQDDGGVRGRTAEEAEANAHLIAAAPELLEALQTLNLVIGLTPIAGNKDALQEACDIARAAIAKAEGRVE